MTTPDPGVYISPAQTYQEVRDLAKAVGRIEAKLDSILNETNDIRTDLADHESRLRALEAMPKTTDIEPRVSTLEKGRWPLPSLAAVTAVGALAVALYQALGG
ncbi:MULTISPECIES: hypothetical protein [unclassified Streptomyces]|uniref:hypothetical protein n=1 Tax=unclassified Streptomyces TaxID=2593676 RepID=UPI001488CEA8|nr:MULTISPECIES: hypothetical protein [unclassified Streptomyces]